MTIRRPSFLFRSLFLLVLFFLLPGCVGGRSAAAEYQLLTARASANDSPTMAGQSIGVGPVHVAQFLNRPQVVTHGGGTLLRVSETHHWGEPLEQGIQRVMLQNIAALTGAETRNFPWRQNATPDYALRIDVIDLDKLPNGDSILEVNWLLEDLKNPRVLKTQQEQIKTTTNNYDDLFAQLAQHVVDVLHQSN
ncbi:MAG TPA: PqiC family protein [Spongiibacteraceae bacterium]